MAVKELSERTKLEIERGRSVAERSQRYHLLTRLKKAKKIWEWDEGENRKSFYLYIDKEKLEVCLGVEYTGASDYPSTLLIAKIMLALQANGIPTDDLPGSDRYYNPNNPNQWVEWTKLKDKDTWRS